MSIVALTFSSRSRREIVPSCRGISRKRTRTATVRLRVRARGRRHACQPAGWLRPPGPTPGWAAAASAETYIRRGQSRGSSLLGMPQQARPRSWRADMIVADCGIEVVETETGAHQRYDRQIDASRAVDICLALSGRHLPRVESDEEIHAVEPDPTRLEPPGQAFGLGPKPAELINPRFPSDCSGILVVLRYVGTKSLLAVLAGIVSTRRLLLDFVI